MKTLSKVLSLAVATPMLASLLAGCGEKQDETTGTKDSLIFSINADIVSMDCHMARDTVTSIIHYQVYETLVRNQPGEGIVPGLAESWNFRMITRKSRSKYERMLNFIMEIS